MSGKADNNKIKQVDSAETSRKAERDNAENNNKVVENMRKGHSPVTASQSPSSSPKANTNGHTTGHGK